MKVFTSALLLLGLLGLHPAHAFVDPPWITPEHPQANETVNVSLRFGICDVILTEPVPPQVTQSGSSVRILLWSVHNTDPTLCNYPIWTAAVPVGAFPPGSYTLQVDRWYQSGLGGGTTTETLGVLPFTVEGGAAPPATPLPTLGGLASIALGLLLGLFAVSRLRGAHRVLLVAAFAALPVARANDVQPPPPADLPPNHAIELLLRLDPNAPTAEDLVAYAEHPDGTPPLAAFAVIPPDAITYAMPIRAEGDFREWLEANPESPRARMERYLIVHYAEPIDLRLALDALRIDPYVEAAQEPAQLRFNSVELIDFGVDGPQGSDGRYGRATLNIDTAWAITGGGYGLVQVIDSGLSTQHPQLRQFDNAGNYVGGNFVPVASLDIGGSMLKSNPLPPDACVDEREPMYYPSCTDDGLVVNLPPPCRADGPNMVSADFAVGHGTHTSSLLAANGTAGTIEGICKSCGIALWKTLYTGCIGGNASRSAIRAAARPAP